MDFATTSALGALRTRRQWLVFVTLAVVATLAAHVLDAAAWQHLRDPRIYEKDLGRLLRLIGYLPTWLIVAGALWTHDRAAPERRAVGWGWRGGLVLLAPTVGGALAEVLKMLVRRLRPVAEVFGYDWRPYSVDLFSTRGLGMPSSHTLVAFAAAAALSRVFPRAWVMWYVLALGCAITRVLSLGHFLSDTVVAAFLGYVVGVLLARTGGFGRSLSGNPSLHADSDLM
ncbi:MAG: phosphatase PAP2 family protein [Gemmatimonadaceae bacterium]|nr:phosphatase PAP2 family protein [Gemmatimonadaceae bacterium]